MRGGAALCAAAAAAGAAARNAPCVTLRNAAAEDVCMPVHGLGAGGYTFDPQDPKGRDCWQDFDKAKNCSEGVLKALLTYVDDLGGRRIDDANTYFHENTTAAFLRQTKVPRDQIWITNKFGSGLAFPPSNLPPGFIALFPFGYDEAVAQGSGLAALTGGYSDILMTHYPYSGWPGVAGDEHAPQSTDKYCNTTSTTFNDVECRLSTYRGMLELLRQGKTRAVGVSNYNISHLEEIVSAKLPLPAVVQNPFNPHRKQDAMLAFCKRHGILFNGYSPLGVPPVHDFPATLGGRTDAPARLFDEPALKQVAANHNATPAQVLINWQWAQGAVTNPATLSRAHMAENLAALDFELTREEVELVKTVPEGACDEDPNWYECAPTPTTCPPMHCNFKNAKGERCLRNAILPCAACTPTPYPGGCWPTDV